MLEPTGPAPTRRIVTILMASTVAGYGGGGIGAQSPLPFAPPVTTATYAMAGQCAIVDVNRDASPDLVVPGVLFGMTLTTLDERGGVVFANGSGPVIGSTLAAMSFARPVAFASGRLDGDELEDLVVVTAGGSVQLLSNEGSTEIDRAAFASPVVLDDFSQLMPAVPPFSSYSFPGSEVLDLDGDGHRDVVLAGGVVDRWSGAAGPGMVIALFGDGQGGFTVQRVPLTGNVIDLEWADLDGDGAEEHLVVLVEDGAVGSFQYHLVHLHMQGGALVTSGFPQLVGPGRSTALEVADLDGDGFADYVLSQLAAQGTMIASSVYYYPGDGAGNLSSTNWGVLTLPAPATTAVSDYVPSLQIDDFDRDGVADLVLLRGTLTTLPQGTLAASLGGAEVLYLRGPVLTANAVRVPLAGGFYYSACEATLFWPRPLLAEPDYLRCVDFGCDASIDLSIVGMRSLNVPATLFGTTFKNTTPPAAGDASYEKVGDASGGVAGTAARIGFEGGRPQPGNSAFSCTVQNVRPGSLVGLMWGNYAQAGLATVFGFDLHVAPSEFGFAAVAVGNGVDDGFYSYPLPIPNTAALVGDVGYFQYNYYDPVLGVLGATQATGLWVGN